MKCWKQIADRKPGERLLEFTMKVDEEVTGKCSPGDDGSESHLSDIFWEVGGEVQGRLCGNRRA